MEAHGAIYDRYKWDEVKKSKKSTSLEQKQRKLNAYIRSVVSG